MTINRLIAVLWLILGGAPFSAAEEIIFSDNSIIRNNDVTPALVSPPNEKAATTWGWGWNPYGQLGDGTVATSYPFGKSLPLRISGLSGVAVAGGLSHSLVLKSDGTVWAWGYNYDGELGDGTFTTSSPYGKPLPVQASGLSGVDAVAAGAWHSLALKSDGTVWAWGGNYSGQLGDGTLTKRSLPLQVGGLNGVVAVAAGGNHSLALKSDGTVWAWGGNYSGQLGDGAFINRSRPVQISGLDEVVALAGGGHHSMALKSDGTVWAWGDNAYGQLGDGTFGKRSSPTQISGLNGVVAVAGGMQYSLALKSDGTVWAWGYNIEGQMGDGTVTISAPYGKPLPVQVKGLKGVVALAAGGWHILALKSDGTVWAWGYGGDGELGDGTYTTSPPYGKPIPVQVSGLNEGVAVAAGGWHSLALKSGDVADSTVPSPAARDLAGSQ